VNEGDHLDKGAEIAEIERQPLDDVLVQSEAQVKQADVAVANAEIARKRAYRLVETGVAARQQLDDATARYEMAVSAATAARAAAAVSRRSVMRTSVASPIAGVVIRILRRTGELVDGTAMTPVAEVADPDALELTASSGAADIVRLARGQHAEVHFEILGDAGVDGEVRAVAPAVDPITGLGAVRLGLRPKGRLPMGVFGEASVAVGERSNVITLPAGALRTGPDGRPEAVVCHAGKAKTRSLRVGRRLSDRVEKSRVCGKASASSRTPGSVARTAQSSRCRRERRGLGATPLVLLVLLVGLFAGLFAERSLPSAVYPEVDFRRIGVVVRQGDMPPDLMQTTILRPIEQTLMTVLGVQRVRSRTIRGGA
jgi:RND family efflux transporter MFP subunit